MALLVQKFGGTSLGSLMHIEQVADKVLQTKQQGHQVVVVVSAMGGDTDRLIKMGKTLNPALAAREYSALAASGEQISMTLLALALIERNCPAVSFTGQQAGILTEDNHKNARIVELNCERVQQALGENKVPIIAGFQGVTRDGDITTLGRGGSDTTAVAIAAALKADECQIFTDVDGVYTTDPRVVPEARRLEQITFEEMLEMASLGAKVLQLRSVELAGKYGVPVRVLSTFEAGTGTLITLEDRTMEQPLVSGIAFNRNEAKITVMGVSDTPGVAYKLLGPISQAGIEVDMVIQNIAVEGKTDFTFTVHRDNYQHAMDILRDTTREMGTKRVVGDNKIAKVSLVGVGMRSHSGIASKMFSTLGQENINIQMIATSEIKISVVIDEKYLELGVRALHEAFALDKIVPREEFDPLKQGS